MDGSDVLTKLIIFMLGIIAQVGASKVVELLIPGYMSNMLIALERVFWISLGILLVLYVNTPIESSRLSLSRAVLGINSLNMKVFQYGLLVAIVGSAALWSSRIPVSASCAGQGFDYADPSGGIRIEHRRIGGGVNAGHIQAKATPMLPGADLVVISQDPGTSDEFWVAGRLKDPGLGGKHRQLHLYPGYESDAFRVPGGTKDEYLALVAVDSATAGLLQAYRDLEDSHGKYASVKMPIPKTWTVCDTMKAVHVIVDQ